MDESLQPYQEELGRILESGGGWGWPTFAQLLDHLYLGAEGDATNVNNLRELGITHVINCAESYICTGEDFYGDIKYMGFEGEDDDDYDILQHFEVVLTFIDAARQAGGKVLIHCIMGINRSGALALAYIMTLNDIGPLAAAKIAKQKRHGLLVTNHGFQKRLIQFAQNKGLLEKDKDLLPPRIDLD